MITGKEISVLKLRSGVIATLIYLTTSSCSLLGQSPHHCDAEQEINFLPFGPEIVGSWVEVRPDGATGELIEFDEAGKLVHQAFGCWYNLFPLVEGDYNTGSGFGGRALHLDAFDISQGYFKLSGSYTFEGQLQQGGSLEIKSSPEVAHFTIKPGIYVKRDDSG